MRTYTASPLYTPPDAAWRYLPEGPLPLDPKTWPWPGAWVAWVAIQHGDDSEVGSLNVLNLDTLDNRNVPLPGRPGFVTETTRPGVLLVGMERELVLVDANPNRPALHRTGLHIIDHPRTIINDGLATPFGVIFGTKDLRFQNPLGHLYLFRNGEARLITLCDGQTCSNGKVVLPDGKRWRLIDIDSPTRQVVAYTLDVHAGTLDAHHVVADFTEESHVPDGMCLTPDGRSVIVAYYNPDDVPFGLARQISLETGRTEVEWRLPASPRVTCPTFVKRGGRIHLLLTTAVEGMTSAQLDRHRHAGSLFLAETSWETLPPPAPKIDVDVFFR